MNLGVGIPDSGVPPSEFLQYNAERDVQLEARTAIVDMPHSAAEKAHFQQSFGLIRICKMTTA